MEKQNSFIKLIREIEFISKEKSIVNGIPIEVGNVRYIYKSEYERIPILFMGAFKIKHWIITIEKRTDIQDSPITICGIRNGNEHCSFKSLEKDEDAYKALFEFVMKEIIPKV